MGRPRSTSFRRGVACVCLVTAVGCVTAPNRRDRQRAFEARQAHIDAQSDPAWRKRDKPRITAPGIEALRALAIEVGATAVPIDAPCLDRICSRRALGRLFEKLDRIDEERQGVARILLLGDSHIAADYIARTIRDRLQRRFGNAGRGFIAIDQKAQYGGRRLTRSYWSRTRIVDSNGPGQAFGFAGMRMDARRPGAELTFELEPTDDDVVAYYLGQPRSARLRFYAHNEEIGRVQTRAERPTSRIFRIAIPEHALGTAEPPTELRIVAQGPKTVLFGLSFESYESGVILDAIGPVGADARAYLQMEPSSLKQHLRALDPDVVMLMLGGNDALAIRKGNRTLTDVEEEFHKLLARLKAAVPDADCLLWGPLDAADRVDGRIESKADLAQMRDLQRRVASRDRCAFWDTYEAMGGRGAFARWFAKSLMNKDLIHPRSKGGDLLGHLFVVALMDAYLNGS